MSTSYSAQLIVGVPITMVCVNGKITKYNEDTGKPYKKPIKLEQYNIQSAGGFVTKKQLDEYDDFVFRDYNSMPELFGICLNSVDTCKNSIYSWVPDNLTDVIDNAIATLHHRYGIYDDKIGVHLRRNVS